MFEITLNGRTLYHPNSLDCIITDAVIHEALNDAGYMDLTIPYNNAEYNNIAERQGKIIVYKDNVEIWYGEVRDISVDFAKNKTLYIVGEASYLNDTVQPQREMKGTKYQILSQMLNHHNNMVEKEKQFEIGMIGANAQKQMEIVADWEYTLDAIRNHLCEEEEYFRIRHVSGKRYVDIMPINSYGKRSEQTIMFGDNLLDYTEDTTGEGLATICIPLGMTKEEGGIENYENYITCEEKDYPKNYVELPGAINRLGRITKVVHFNGLEVPKELRAAALTYLQSAQYAKMTLNLSAIDLSILQNDIDNYSVGDYIRAICEPMGMDAWFPVRSRETDLLNLANNKISIGASSLKTITQKLTESMYEVETKIPSKDSILNQAKKNASALINGAGTNGHVVLHENDKGVVYEILIMNTDKIETATKIWRWNENGFGYSNTKDDDGNPIFGLAMTMDGAIVADYVTTGQMSANRIRGGSFEVGGTGYAKDGSIVVKNATGQVLITLNKDGISLTNGQTISYSNISNKPTIPSRTSQLTNDSGFKTVVTATDITTGTMLANRIRGGELKVGGSGTDSSGNTYNADGTVEIYDANDKVIATFKKEGSTIGGFTIDEDNLHVGGSGSGIWITGKDENHCPYGYVAVGQHGPGLIRLGYKHNGRIGIAMEIDRNQKKFIDLWELGDDM